MRVTWAFTVVPRYRKSIRRGPSSSKKNISIIFPALVWITLDFFVVLTLDASTGSIVSILVRSNNTKTHLQPPLVPGNHSLPWHRASDDQYSGSCRNSSGRFSVTLHTVQISLPVTVIFGPLKKALRGKRFTLDDDVKQYVRNCFTTQSREFYETPIHSLVSQLDKCLNSQGQYF